MCIKSLTFGTVYILIAVLHYEVECVCAHVRGVRFLTISCLVLPIPPIRHVFVSTHQGFFSISNEGLSPLNR